MLPCLMLFLLMGLSTHTMAGDSGEEGALDTEAGPWITEGSGPSIQLQLREVKRGKASQFFGLMGKRLGGRKDDDQGSE
ncbi:tachykinin-4 [Carlito syrichta]|uniref:Tachykinin-4 n=1 Tax=Carlito syrichta TaxID=1868482 RepID=A0A1U7TQ68_CARSF|nr:tachykinin-4 [Carlito syrichta]